MSFIGRNTKKRASNSQSISSSSEDTMSKCPKCGEPVYFAEKRIILGKDWHAKCLRCDNCDKQLTPGKHSAHMNKPYCNACYQLMFGPEGFRQGTVEPRKVLIKGATGTRRDTLSKSDVKSKIKEYNLYKNSPVDKLKSREANGQILFEGLLKLYWGLKRPISLSPGVDSRLNRSSARGSIIDYINVDDDAYTVMIAEAESEKKKRDLEKSERKLHAIVSSGWDSQSRMPRKMGELSECADITDLTASLPTGPVRSNSIPQSMEHQRNGRLGGSRRTSNDSTSSSSSDEMDGNSMSGGPRSFTRGNSMEPGLYNSRSPVRKRSASFRKISKHKKMEGRYSDVPYQFIPPYGSQTSVRVTSIIPTKDVILMLMAKYKVENPVTEFGLCVIYDSGMRELLGEDDYPLQRRLKLGPSEDIAKVFIVEAETARAEQLSEEVQAWIKFSVVELQQFARKFEEEEEREVDKIRRKFSWWKDAMLEQQQNGGTEWHQTDV